MKGVLDLVNEFHTFKGGSCAPCCEGGSRHGGCWREDMGLAGRTDTTDKDRNRCFGNQNADRRERRGIKREEESCKLEGYKMKDTVELIPRPQRQR